MTVSCHLLSLHHPPGQCHQVSWFIVQYKLSCLESCHIEQILGEFIQSLCRQVNFTESFGLPLSEGRAFTPSALEEQHLRIAFQHQQRIAQFMRGDTEKLVHGLPDLPDCPPHPGGSAISEH